MQGTVLMISYDRGLTTQTWKSSPKIFSPSFKLVKVLLMHKAWKMSLMNSETEKELKHQKTWSFCNEIVMIDLHCYLTITVRWHVHINKKKYKKINNKWSFLWKCINRWLVACRTGFLHFSVSESKWEAPCCMPNWNNNTKKNNNNNHTTTMLVLEPADQRH